MKVEIPQPTADVIDITVKREGRFGRSISRKCLHNRVSIDPLLVTIECRDCSAQLSPVAWLADHAEYWSFVREQHRRYVEAKVAFDAKQRCRCEHCGKITKVRPATAAEVRDFKRNAQCTKEPR